MPPSYTLEKIKFATDPQTFERAVDLYESGKVTRFRNGIRSYSAIVIGSKPYNVSGEARRFDYGNCDCYIGQNDELCKHLVALAIHAVMRGKKLRMEDKEMITGPECSENLGELTKVYLSSVKNSITGAIRYIKAYSGPSRTWFAYQNSLDEGCNRLSKIISDLPVSKQTTKLLVDLLLRLDEKLCRGGVDDSNGTVGGFIEEAVEVLKEYARLDPSCIEVFKNLIGKETCFGWEAPLVEILDETVASTP
jgi:hypothetical protein